MGIIDSVTGKIAEQIEETVQDVAQDVVLGTVKITGKAVKGTAKGVVAAAKGIKNAGTSAGGALEKMHNDKAARHYQREKDYIAKLGDARCLIIQYEKKNIFKIYNDSEALVYRAEGGVSSKNNKGLLRLYGFGKNPIGHVRKATRVERSPLYHESNPADYCVELSGQNIATVKTTISTGLFLYEVLPFGWKIKGGKVRWDYEVIDGDDRVAHVSKRKGYEKPTYILDFKNESQELISLMMALTLICVE